MYIVKEYKVAGKTTNATMEWASTLPKNYFIGKTLYVDHTGFDTRGAAIKYLNHVRR